MDFIYPGEPIKGGVPCQESKDEYDTALEYMIWLSNNLPLNKKTYSGIKKFYNKSVRMGKENLKL